MRMCALLSGCQYFYFFNDPAPSEIYTLSLHDALPICPHGVSWQSGVQTASLDHIIWFHRPTNFSEWHLYVQDSPRASCARGCNRGAIYRNDGTLVSSTAQEGLSRTR